MTKSNASSTSRVSLAPADVYYRWVLPITFANSATSLRAHFSHPDETDLMRTHRRVAKGTECKRKVHDSYQPVTECAGDGNDG